MTDVLQDRITRLILEKGLRPGDTMPPEPQLIETLRASRNSVREALRALHTLGIVEIRHGYGTFVGAAPLTAFTPGLLFQARQSVPDGATALRHLAEVRHILELGLVGRVVERADDVFLAELDAVVDAMEAGQGDADQQFHELLYRPTGNDVAVQLIRLFWTVYHQLEAELDPPEHDRGAICSAHRAIVDTLRARDADAARDAVSRHFADVEARVSRLVAASEPADGPDPNEDRTHR